MKWPNHLSFGILTRVRSSSYSPMNNFKKLKVIPYFFGFKIKTEFFSCQNNLKDLDPSYKMDLDLWELEAMP